MTGTYVIATANPDKAAEIEAVLTRAVPGIHLRRRPVEVPEVDETGDTLETNARLKAQALAEATGLPAIADDTGLQVDALGGAPGVRSSRFAGENASYDDNVAKLLDELAGVTAKERTARFTTVAIARWPDGRELVARGEVEGTIAPEPRGAAGFGYDPVFEVAELGGRTFAQVSANEKHEVSHRGRAFRALAALLRNGTFEA